MDVIPAINKVWVKINGTSSLSLRFSKSHGCWNIFGSDDEAAGVFPPSKEVRSCSKRSHCVMWVFWGRCTVSVLLSVIHPHLRLSSIVSRLPSKSCFGSFVVRKDFSAHVVRTWLPFMEKLHVPVRNLEWKLSSDYGDVPWSDAEGVWV